MRKMITMLAITVLASAACTGEVVVSEGLWEIVAAFEACDEAILSGEPMAADEIANCVEVAGSASATCPDGTEVASPLGITDGRSWVLREGSPARPLPADLVDHTFADIQWIGCAIDEDSI